MEKTGKDLRDEGVVSVDGHTPEAWRDSAQLLIAQLASTGQPFTAEDIRSAVGDPPNHHNAMGAQIIGAAKAGLIEKIGYTQPTRRSRHASVMAVWRGKP